MAAGTSWRLFGSRRAAETLLAAMSADDEQSQMLAGMSLVKAGQRSFDLIQDRIEAGQASAHIVRLLPDIDRERARPVLEKVVRGAPGEMTDAARECIELLDRIDKLEGEEP
jgi:radical SAM superfamily enzyme with C-terminal helix-hairpin-helix motif